MHDQAHDEHAILYQLGPGAVGPLAVLADPFALLERGNSRPGPCPRALRLDGEIEDLELLLTDLFTNSGDLRFERC